MSPERIILAQRLSLFYIFVTLVRGYIYNGLYGVDFADTIQEIYGAHDIGFVGFNRSLI